jgi:hypothetical protein
MNEVMRIVKEEHLDVPGQHFDNKCVVTIAIRKMQVNQVLARLQKIPQVDVKYLYTL